MASIRRMKMTMRTNNNPLFVAPQQCPISKLLLIDQVRKFMKNMDWGAGVCVGFMKVSIVSG